MSVSPQLGNIVPSPWGHRSQAVGLPSMECYAKKRGYYGQLAFDIPRRAIKSIHGMRTVENMRHLRLENPP